LVLEKVLWTAMHTDKESYSMLLCILLPSTQGKYETQINTYSNSITRNTFGCAEQMTDQIVISLLKKCW
jgi:hypothetical protein